MDGVNLILVQRIEIFNRGGDRWVCIRKGRWGRGTKDRVVVGRSRERVGCVDERLVNGRLGRLRGFRLLNMNRRQRVGGKRLLDCCRR